MGAEEQLVQRLKQHLTRVQGALKLADARSHDPRKPDVSYQIMLGSDDRVYCTCPRWLYTPEEPQTCKHLDDFRNTLRKIQ